MKEENNKTGQRWLAIAALIITLALWRAFVVDGSTNLLANFTPIGAIALFAGATLQNRKMRYLFPLAILLISDLLMVSDLATNPLLYSGWIWTYLAFIIAVFFGEMFFTDEIEDELLKQYFGTSNETIKSKIYI